MDKFTKNLIDDLAKAEAILEKIGYSIYPGSLEWEELQGDEYCQSCERKHEERTLLNERG